MTSASMVAMPIRGALPRSMAAAVAFPARAEEQRRSARLSMRPAAACVGGGGGEDQPPPSVAAMPASLRAIQAKRKLAAAPRAAGATSAAECAVAALVRAVGAVHGAAAGGARGAGDAVAWVVSKVHDFQASSPELAVSGLLGMLTSCLGTAVQAEAERARAMTATTTTTAQAKKPDDAQEEGEGLENPDPDETDGDDDEPEVVADEDLPQLVETDMEKELWARIGIMHGDPLRGGDSDEEMFEGLDEEEIQDINSARARRRKAAYERVIAGGGANSLILSNYAQLLYEFDKDMKRLVLSFFRCMHACSSYPITCLCHDLNNFLRII